MEGSSSRSFGYHDFMGAAAAPENQNFVRENPAADRENGWPIKRELTHTEVQNDVLYIQKEEFWTYILPNIPRNYGDKLLARGDMHIMVKDERCSFYVANLTLYENFYVLSSVNSQGHTFIRSRGLVSGQKIWVRWTNGYLEVKVFE